uniref:WAT1-related protein n=1 Tax=Kalanchoe fedtschenkoi TaxID=63787 RepID=A0A7N0RB88_KALFE
MRGCADVKPVFTMVAINFAFAIVNILIKKIMELGADHLVIVAYRQLASAILVSPIAYFLERNNTAAKLTPRILCYLFFSALLGVTLTQYLFLLALEHTTATFSCAFINLAPVTTFLMALPFGFEKVKVHRKSGLAKILGTIVCLGGAVAITLYQGIALNSPHEMRGMSGGSKKKDPKWALGSVLLMVGTFTWSSWFLIQAVIGKAYPAKRYTSTAIMSLFSTVQSAILCMIVSRNPSKWVLKGALEISTIIYAGAIGSGLCYVGMSWCVDLKGPVFTSAFSPLVQIFVAIISLSLNIEQIHLGSILGSVFIVAGLYVLLWGKAREAKECGLKLEKHSAALVCEDHLPVTHDIPISNCSAKT